MAHTAHALDLGTPLMAALHMNLASVESGLPASTLAGFVSASGIPLKDVYDVVIPARTLKHRKARKEPLSLDESDKLVRLVRVYDQTVRVFGDRENALHWLSEPKRRFEGRTPLQLLRTDYGSRLVEEMLGQIDHGIFA
ncbi:MAG TPA: antitoxin Xre/MbcA/ParS toxin-binding domain-containing protein [Acidobacteriaceae bacterium]|nr:antitoxin Xre/MbcA/ParS toxin-binding domain-containing protein [Acidobacteriaceae bacterium]